MVFWVAAIEKECTDEYSSAIPSHCTSGNNFSKAGQYGDSSYKIMLIRSDLSIYYMQFLVAIGDDTLYYVRYLRTYLPVLGLCRSVFPPTGV